SARMPSSPQAAAIALSTAISQVNSRSIGPPTSKRIARYIASVAACRLFDSLICATEQAGGHGKAQLLRRLEVENQFERDRLLNGKIARTAASQDFVGKKGGGFEVLSIDGSEGNQPRSEERRVGKEWRER